MGYHILFDSKGASGFMMNTLVLVMSFVAVVKERIMHNNAWSCCVALSALRGGGVSVLVCNGSIKECSVHCVCVELPERRRPKNKK